MRRYLLFLLLVIIQVTSVFAGGVSVNEIKQIALNWQNAYGNKNYYGKDILKIDTFKESGEDLIYIVSFKPEGWVMVSANNKTEPVLGYSVSSVFDMDKIPVQFQGWVEGLQNEIRAVSADENYTPAPDLAGKWSVLKSANADIVKLKSSTAISAGPLLSTTWNQGQYFNELAPEDASSSAGNGHVWIGCVATAMAQVMKYWSYPVSGIGSHSYNHSNYGTQFADFGNSTYDWDAMPNHLNSGNSEVQKISYHTAVAVNMDFGPGGSGAYLTNARDALSDYFKYNTTVFLSDKNEWDSDLLWMQMLRDEIDNGRPVIYSGYNASLSSGHAFVCDGYSSGDFFHFNWGWGGYADGNFLLTALEPAGRDYTTNQSAIFGVEPVSTVPISIPYSQGFESGLNGFTLFGEAAVSVSESHTGSYSVRLSQPGFTSRSLNVANLTFIVPTDGTLDFWVKRYTGQTSGLNTQKALLMPEHGDVPLITFFDDNFNDDEWVNIHQDISTYAGQIVRLMFVQQNFDYSREQWMFVDDVVITGGSVNIAPYVPSAPKPSNNATAIELEPLLRWQGGDPNGDDVVYSIYFGNNTNPAFVGSTFDRFYNPGMLGYKNTYYWRVEASDGSLTSASPLWSFTTQGVPPVVETCGTHDAGSNFITICGRIIDDKGSAVNDKGVCWDSKPNVTLSDNVESVGGSSADFDVDISGLQPYSVYYARAYAITDDGIGYGEEIEFKTLAGLPELALSGIDSIKRSSAVVTGFLQKINDEFIHKRGAVWSEVDNFDVVAATEVFEEGSWDCVCDFSIELNDLPGPDTIFYRLFAENSVGRAYSEQSFFVTTNQSPIIDLDADNSLKKYGNHYASTVTERQAGGRIADVDVRIYDEDNDVLQSIIVKIDIRENENEYLVFNNTSNDVHVFGDTDSLVLENISVSTNEQWEEILQTVEFFVDNHAPDTKLERRVSVIVYDGYDYSIEAYAYLKVNTINDPPVNLTLPAISHAPIYGSTVSAVPGLWSDTLDKIDNAEFLFDYKWQWTDGESVFDITENNESLFIDDLFCGMQVRLVEIVTDLDNGGDNVTTAFIQSDWVEVQRNQQEVLSVGVEGYTDKKPLLEYRTEPYRLNGESTSGLPLRFGTHNDNVFEVLGDSLFVKNITNAAAVWAIHDGSICYEPSDLKYMVAQVEKGFQEITVNTDTLFNYADSGLVVDPISTSGLDVAVNSTDTTILRVDGHQLVINGVGRCDLIFTQTGNERYMTADTVIISVTIERGKQQIAFEVDDLLFYGGENAGFSVESNTVLTYDIIPDDTLIVDVLDGMLIANGVGETFLNINNMGSDLWIPFDTLVEVSVLKGFQLIDAPDTIYKQYGDEPFEVEAVASSSLPVELLYIDESLASSQNGIITVENVGTGMIVVEQSGNNLWNSIADTIILVVQKGTQNIVFEPLETMVYGDERLEIPGEASSGLPLTYISSDTLVARVDGYMLEVTGAGQCNIEAFQSGNNLYKAAETISQTLIVEKAEQTILTTLPDSITTRQVISRSDFYTSSGLEGLEFSSSNENVIRVVPDTIVVADRGEAEITVTHDGNNNYLPASESFFFVVNFPLDIKVFESVDIEIFPNPASDRLHIMINGQVEYPLDYSLLNILGQAQLKGRIEKPFEVVDIERLNKGSYIILLRSKEQYMKEKIVVE
ncbi:MAG: C10 family peptidase [Prolixibacteraceae bacterium]|nr:C10 family peptidase [Prolixibacteraceae bacterium]